MTSSKSSSYPAVSSAMSSTDSSSSGTASVSLLLRTLSLRPKPRLTPPATPPPLAALAGPVSPRSAATLRRAASAASAAAPAPLAAAAASLASMGATGGVPRPASMRAVYCPSSSLPAHSDTTSPAGILGGGVAPSVGETAYPTVPLLNPRRSWAPSVSAAAASRRTTLASSSLTLAASASADSLNSPAACCASAAAFFAAASWRVSFLFSTACALLSLSLSASWCSSVFARSLKSLRALPPSLCWLLSLLIVVSAVCSESRSFFSSSSIFFLLSSSSRCTTSGSNPLVSFWYCAILALALSRSRCSLMTCCCCECMVRDSSSWMSLYFFIFMRSTRHSSCRCSSLPRNCFSVSSASPMTFSCCWCIRRSRRTSCCRLLIIRSLAVTWFSNSVTFSVSYMAASCRRSCSFSRRITSDSLYAARTSLRSRDGRSRLIPLSTRACTVSSTFGRFFGLGWLSFSMSGY
mmetsp:Transcript_20879/g.48772  ORF Transcript_20879/g.48772 Transcript_20879/m.48772 type:complete len:465 (-) Transcript_20879:1267-2661(-)